MGTTSIQPSALQRRAAILVLALLLLAYTIARASAVSFSWDEAYTFMNHVRKDVFFLGALDIGSANHHMLNVWGMWICAKVFGTDEFSLRVPNLLGHVLYLYATARIALKAERFVLCIVVFLLLNVHPYVLDFFGLARGYGLSFGFMMMALWQLHRFATEGRTGRAAIRGTMHAALATLAHTIMLNFFLGLVAAFVGTWLVKAWTSRSDLDWKPILAIGAIVLACLAMVVPNAVGMHHIGALFHGSDTLWEGMMRSLAERATYHFVTPFLPLTTMGIFVSVVLVFSAWTLIMAFSKERNCLPLLLGLVVSTLVLLLLYIQHHFLDLPWPRTRTALFLLPLLSYLLVAAMLAWRPDAFQPVLLGSALAMILVLHFGRSMNLAYVIEWKESGAARQLLEFIEKDHLPLTEERPIITVSTGGECGPVLDYYIYTRGWQWLVNSDQPKHDSFPRCEYHLVEWTAEQWIEHPNWTLLYRSNETGTSLYRDQRLHRSFDSLAYRGSMPASQADVIVRDGIPEPELRWAVPEGIADSSVLVTCKVRALEQTDQNWLTIAIEHVRGEQALERGGVASYHQVRTYGSWGSEYVTFMPKQPLLPGDEIVLTITPLIRDPRIHIGDIELWVMK